MWNISSFDMRQEGIVVKNICSKGVTWNDFFTKLEEYLKYVKDQIHVHETDGRSNSIYAVLMDSDTLFSGAASVSKLWIPYDCITLMKPQIVVATETSCWIGRFCTPENITEYYPAFKTAPSYSPFINSGVIMGPMKQLATMLSYIIDNKSKYFMFAPHKNVWLHDDQFALTDYCLKVNPAVCAIDYHQQLSATYALTLRADHKQRVDEKWTFVCRMSNDELSYHCPDVTYSIVASGAYSLSHDSCAISRQWNPELNSITRVRNRYRTELDTLAPMPPIYHGKLSDI